MKPTERGLSIGLAIVLAAGLGYFLWTGTRDEEPRGLAGTGRLPDPGQILRQFDTPGGVTVQVVQEGDGEVRQKGEAMDIAFVGYIADSGAKFDQGVKRGLVLENGGVIEGWIEGLKGMRRREKRRLIVPNKMAYGDLRTGKIRPGADLVFDVQWAALKIEDLVEGSGDAAKEGDSVTVHYKGTLENGTVFDSSYRKGEPITFTLRRGGLIEGWILGVPGMRVGGKRRLWVPWHLGYGDRSAPGGGIPPFSNLIFEIELLAVN